MELLERLCGILGILFVLCYAHQYVYTVLSILRRPKPLPDAPERRYGVLIAARNEEGVIGALLESIAGQDYPADKLDVFVVADNCTDKTAVVARAAGARVFERFDTERVGKGYALDFLLREIDKECGLSAYDGYFVFDADNLLDEGFVREMNKCFSEERPVVTSYRNSKNYGDNWISAGYSLWFLRDSGQLNAARTALGGSSVVAGTGFLMSSRLLQENGGWHYFLLTEDTEFTIDMILHGVHIAYCGSAVLYDEQPTRFSQSWWQRLRWAKGYLQILRKDGLRMVKGLFGRSAFACFDVAMAFMPAILLSMASFVLQTVQLCLGLFVYEHGLSAVLDYVLLPLAETYIFMLLLGLITVLKEWRHIHARAWQKLSYLLSFPVFMLSYFPIAVTAVFARVQWRPIRHEVHKTLDEVRVA